VRQLPLVCVIDLDRFHYNIYIYTCPYGLIVIMQ
jgi:hypothetical protein